MLFSRIASLRGIVLAAALACLSVTGFAQPSDGPFSGLHWRLVGPFRGGRALAVTGVQGQPETFYFGSVGGGVWKSQNAGRTWKPIFDKEPDASIGAIAVAPSDANTIYVGAGEADMRNDIQQGHGLYKSTDAGVTWKHLGLDDTRMIGKIIVDPGDPEIVYAAAMGHQYGPNEQRGVYKSNNGGRSWRKVLYKGPDTGAIDIEMDPNDSNVIYASMWQTRRPPWSYYPPSNGPGSGLYKSTDAGRKWTQVTGGGFPAFVGRTGIAISPTDSKRIYAFADTNNDKDGGLYRSDDGGSTWKYTCSDHRIWYRGWYFGGITADPKNPDCVYVMNTSAYRSVDGGKTFTAFKGAPGGDDYHTCWIYPDDPTRMIIGNDQGVVVSVDGGASWSSWYNQPTAQIYHVVTDNRFPYWIYGAQQDSGAIAVQSRTIHTGINSMYQRPIDVGGESGTIAVDPLHPGLLLSSGGSKEQFETGWEKSIDPMLGKIDTNWRSEWTQPIAVSPVDPHVFYTSRQKVFRTSDGGATWTTISPDLTRQKHTNPPKLDKATIADNDGQPHHGVVYWLAPSPVRAKQLWAGTDDGLIWLTKDDGKNWSNVTPPQLTPWSKVGIIDASHFNAGIAYAAIDRHRVDDNHPYIFRTSDFGKHWVPITNGIPDDQFVNVVREDPKNSEVLYAGTDWGFYVSLDRGTHWQSLQLNLPAASVRDIAFGGNDIVIATHGRSIWILDDPVPVRQAVSSSRQTVLFKPSKAIVFQRAGTFGFGLFDEGTPLPPEEPQGENAPWGAVIDYTLSHADTLVTFTIADAHGKVIRTLSSSEKVPVIDVNKLEIPAYWVKPESPLSKAPGGHRLLWDFHVQNGGPIVPPGMYSITMNVNGKAYHQPLEVVKDPRNTATAAELKAQYDFALIVQDEIQVARALEARIQARTKKTKSSQLFAILGHGGSGTPDEGGSVATDNGSLRTVIDGLNGVYGTIESAPSAPLAGELEAFRSLKKRVAAYAAEFAKTK